MLEYTCKREGLKTGPGGNCLPHKYTFNTLSSLLCGRKEDLIFMFNFVEQPVKINNYEYSRMPQRPSPVVMQSGLQPVALLQEDVRMVGRPEPLMGSFFGFRRRKG